MNKIVRIHKIKRVHDSHQKSTCHNGRNDRNKNISQKLDCPHKPVLLLYRCLFCFCLGACCHSCNLNKLIKHLVDRTCPQNDLKLS